MAALSKSARNYRKNAESRRKKNAYQAKLNKTPKERAKRARLNKINRDRGTYGNGDGLDASHTKNGVVMKKASVNRGSKTDQPGDKRSRGGKKRKARVTKKKNK